MCRKGYDVLLFLERSPWQSLVMTYQRASYDVLRGE